MKKNTQKTASEQGSETLPKLTLDKAKEYAKNDLKVSIGFLEFILRDQDVLELVAQKMLILQEQLEKNKAAQKPTE